MLLPTAFMWGATFAILRKILMKRFDKRKTAIFASGTAALLLVSVPIPARMLAASNVAQHTIEDILPSAPITPFGTVRLDLIRPDWDQNKSARLERNLRPYACDSLCVSFLFAPNVTSVTVNKSRDAKEDPRKVNAMGLTSSARTYQLLPRSQCANHMTVEPRLMFGEKLWGTRRVDWENIEATWRKKLASEFCILSEPPIPQYDLLLREAKEQDPANAKPRTWSLGPSPTHIRDLAIRDGNGEFLLHLHQVSAQAPAIPLVASINGPIQSGFDWNKSTFDDGKAAPPTLEIVEAVRIFTTIPQSLPRGPM